MQQRPFACVQIELHVGVDRLIERHERAMRLVCRDLVVRDSSVEFLTGCDRLIQRLIQRVESRVDLHLQCEALLQRLRRGCSRGSRATWKARCDCAVVLEHHR